MRPSLSACLATVTFLLTLPGAPASAQEADYEALPAGTVNFSEHIAPIVFRHCVRCHSDEPSAPFSLHDYASVRAKGRDVGRATQRGTMPPALAEPGYGPIANSGRLSTRELGLLEQWLSEGTPEGDRTNLPALPQPGGEWKLGPPDLVLEAGSFEVQADAFGLVRNFPLDLELDSRRWVRAVSLNRHSPTYVRALLFVDPTGTTASAAPDDPDALARMNPPLAFAPHPALGAQILMTRPWTLPDGAAWPIDPGTGLTAQIHFQGTGVAMTAQPKIGLYFGDEPLSHLVTVSVGERDFEIPAGDADFHVRSKFTLPVATEATGVLPNAHFLGAELKGWATLPDSSEVGLVWIKEWDFNYQKQYWFRSPVTLPAGTVIEMDFSFDNSDDNFNNPKYPPEDTEWGLSLDGEVAGLNVQLLVNNNEDLAKIERAYATYRETLAPR